MFSLFFFTHFLALYINIIHLLTHRHKEFEDFFFFHIYLSSLKKKQNKKIHLILKIEKKIQFFFLTLFVCLFDIPNLFIQSHPHTHHSFSRTFHFIIRQFSLSLFFFIKSLNQSKKNKQKSNVDDLICIHTHTQTIGKTTTTTKNTKNNFKI